MTCLLELEGVGKVKTFLSKIKSIRNEFLQGAAKEKATDIFNHLDVNGDGRVELGEFVHGSLKDKELVSMLKKKEVEKVTKEKPPDVCVVLVEDED